MREKFYLVVTFIILCTSGAYSQLSFCEGDLGDAIFVEDFGTGTTNGPELGADITSYTYVDSAPEDGFYTVSSQIQQLASFHSGLDNTPGDTDGKAFIVNASFTADQFYQKTIEGLCENTSYEFSAFLQNVYNINSGACPNTGIPVNVQFQIWDSADTVLIASGDTGDIDGTSNPIWTQYGLVFETGVSQTEVILRMINNGDGGCGNDLAIDDIVFRACGDITTISSDVSGEEDLIICDNQSSFSATLSVATEMGVFIQWQVSTDGINWSNITGETSNTYITPVITTSVLYRVNTATDSGNLGNTFCSFFSLPYLIDFVEGPQSPVSNGDVEVCDNEALIPISVSVPSGLEVRWFESATSPEILAIGTSYTPTSIGTYYAQAFVPNTDCGSTLRTPVTLSLLASPLISNPIEQRDICNNQEMLELFAGSTNLEYQWSTGETAPQITITTGGTYVVTVSNNLGCSATKTFEVEGFDSPVISNVFSEGEAIVIQVETQGDFEYSVDGVFYRTVPVFRNEPGGLRTIYVRNSNGCFPTTFQYYHFNIPTYFTPNGDGINDFFLLPDASFFTSSTVRVFDRFGKLLSSGNGVTFRWDGFYNGKVLPPDDYWYEIETNDRLVTGHISLLL